MHEGRMSRIAVSLLLTAASVVSAESVPGDPPPPDSVEDPGAAVLREAPGIGDGVITRADVDALCEFTVWGFNLVLSDAGEDLRLDASAYPRIAAFFLEEWPSLETGVQAFVANASRAAPAARARASGTDADESMDVFLEFSDLVWPGVEGATVAYFAGQLDEAAYAAERNAERREE